MTNWGSSRVTLGLVDRIRAGVWVLLMAPGVVFILLASLALYPTETIQTVRKRWPEWKREAFG